FIVDRNLTDTNICYTDCDFCAFYRRPGDVREGYLLPKPVIFKKIEETLAMGGTGLLMQGGHHPDLGIDYYEDLFRSIKAKYRIHLHALSPPEVQHISRRSSLTIPETLTRLRDAGLDSIPGGGGEVLVDRVREIIAPKKTKTSEWLNVMRHAHRLVVGHAGQEDRPGCAPVRRRRPRQRDDRGERGLGGGNDLPGLDGRVRPSHPVAREDPGAARHAVPGRPRLELIQTGRRGSS